MSPVTLPKILVSAAVVVGLCLSGLVVAEKIHEHQAQASDHQTAIHEGEANAHQSQANASDAKVSDLQAKVDSQAQELGRLNAERDALLKRLAAKPVPHEDPAVPAVGLVDALEAAVSDRDDVIAKDAEVIAAQDGRIKGLEAVNGQLVASRDEWKAAFESERKARQAQEAASRAWKDAVTTSEWKGGIKGFIAGTALGYLGAR